MARRRFVLLVLLLDGCTFFASYPTGYGDGQKPLDQRQRDTAGARLEARLEPRPTPDLPPVDLRRDTRPPPDTKPPVDKSPPACVWDCPVCNLSKGADLHCYVLSWPYQHDILCDNKDCSCDGKQTCSLASLASLQPCAMCIGPKVNCCEHER